MTVKRKRVKSDARQGGNYFANPKAGIKFVLSGSTMLDLALGGGWASGRIVNIVGDKSSGKTLLCIEAIANFAMQYKKGKIKYREAEAAFDQSYAQALGMPLDRVDFGDPGHPIETVEDLFEDLEDTIAEAKTETLYIIDSLDSLSDRSEMGRDIDAGTYGANKAKQLSELFRRLVRNLESSKVTLIVVSQVRAKIGAMFGKKTTRSGGRALDFYASQVVFLSQIATVTKTIGGIKRPVGVQVKAKCEKNKVGLPFREASFKLMFGYGIDDAESCLSFIKEVKSLGEVNISAKDIKKRARSIVNMEPLQYAEAMTELREVCQRRWYEIETSFLPKRSKYGS